jgi:predicted metalloendopeptidase
VPLDCKIITDLLGDAIGAWYLREIGVTTETVQEVKKMFTLIKASMRARFDQLVWLDENTRKEAVKKVTFLL